LRARVFGGIKDSVEQAVRSADEPLGNPFVCRRVEVRVAYEGGREGILWWRVDPCWGAPARLGKPETQAAASCFLTSLARDVENDLLAWPSMEHAVKATTEPETALPLGGGVVLPLSQGERAILHLWTMAQHVITYWRERYRLTAGGLVLEGAELGVSQWIKISRCRVDVVTPARKILMDGEMVREKERGIEETERRHRELALSITVGASWL
jgi:hypothetical protein